MPKKPTKATTLTEIEDALAAEGAAWVMSFRAAHADERPYAFVFEISEVGYAAGAAIATEEGLDRFAAESAESYGGDLRKAKADCRWAGPENGWYQSPDKAFKNTNRLLGVAEATGLYPEYGDTLENLAVAALRRMDAEGCFGEGPARDSLLAGVCLTGGDNSDEQFVRWAEQANPAGVVDRLKRELKERP